MKLIKILSVLALVTLGQAALADNNSFKPQQIEDCELKLHTSDGYVTSHAAVSDVDGSLEVNGLVEVQGAPYSWTLAKSEEGNIMFQVKKQATTVAMSYTAINDSENKKDAAITIMTMASGAPFKLINLNCK